MQDKKKNNMKKPDVKILKRVATVCFVIMVLICGKFWLTFILNEVFIQKYNQREYDEGLLDVAMLVNFPEGYIVHYNLGDVYYQEGQYEKAVEKYEIALKTVPEGRVCDVRMNLGMAKLNLINKKDENAKNKVIEVTKILLADGCAKEQGGGKHAGAQELYDEIMAVASGSDSGNDDDDSDNDPQQGDDSEEKEKEIEQQLRSQAEDTSRNRNNNDAYEPYEYYDGKNW